MPTTPTFDPIFEAYLTGNVDRIVVFDPDDTENRVLPLERPWRVEIEWSLDGSFVSALCGKWNVILSVEGMGERLEADLCDGWKDFLDVEAGSTLIHRMWKFTCQVPGDFATPPPDPKKFTAGVYMVTTHIQFYNSFDVPLPLPMAGHAREPMISFYKP